MSNLDFKTMRERRTDYGMQFEILVGIVYQQIVRPGDHVVDGGANSGLHSVPLARLVGPRGHLDAFEPNPGVCGALRSNLHGMEWAVAHQVALSNEIGELDFVVEAERTGLSHLATYADKGRATIKVPTVTLDYIVSQRPVRFIKLDLEGADFCGLLGAENIIREDNPVIVFENSREWAAKCFNYSKEDFFQYFERLEYSVFDLHGTQLTRANWNDELVAFEFLAFHRYERSGPTLRSTLEEFWNTIDSRPVLTEWSQCVRAVRRMSDNIAT